ncbi:hypothetical protein [Rhizobium phage RHEph12]|nr:hypothetical protein [Rhizobium phage RHEph12]
MTDTTYPNRYTALPGSKVTTNEGGIFAYMYTRYSDNHEADIVHATDYDGNEVHLIAAETEQHAPLPREFTQEEVDAPVVVTTGYFNVGEGNILYTGLLESYRGQPFTIADNDDEDDTDDAPDEDQEARYANFRDQIELLINMHSMENGSNTPDFILAHFLTEQLRLFDSVVTARASHRGEAPIPVEVSTTTTEDEFEGDEAEEGDHEAKTVKAEVVKASAVLSDGEAYDHPDKNGSIDSLPVDVSTNETPVKVVSPGDRRFSDDGVIGD